MGVGGDQLNNGGDDGVDDEEAIGVKCERHWRCFYVIGCLCLFVGFFVSRSLGYFLRRQDDSIEYRRPRKIFSGHRLLV